MYSKNDNGFWLRLCGFSLFQSSNTANSNVIASLAIYCVIKSSKASKKSRVTNSDFQESLGFCVNSIHSVEMNSIVTRGKLNKDEETLRAIIKHPSRWKSIHPQKSFLNIRFRTLDEFLIILMHFVFLKLIRKKVFMWILNSEWTNYKHRLMGKWIFP